MANNLFKIEEFDSHRDIALKIYKYFEIGQSINIKGIEMTRSGPVTNGSLVIECIKVLDFKDNWEHDKRGKLKRKRREPPSNSIGGAMATKIFKFADRIQDGKPIVAIWRIQ